MKWITHEHVRADRVASAWLIHRFVDPQAAFLFAPKDRVMTVAAREHAIPFDMQDVELGHHGKACLRHAEEFLQVALALIMVGEGGTRADHSQPRGIRFQAEPHQQVANHHGDFAALGAPV